MIVKAADSGGRQTWNQPPRPSWRSVPNNTDLDEPGWTPRVVQSRPRIPVITLRQQPQHPPPAPHHRQYPHLQSIRHIEEEPAWYGSLKSATDPKLTDRKVLLYFFSIVSSKLQICSVYSVGQNGLLLKVCDSYIQYHH